ncbi:putative fungal zn binuclear cluster domain containing protein [Diplocarpon rosae]|nr:putative fungal zn binuclear cluster domain containing protein [Diplocarpon rosae]
MHTLVHKPATIHGQHISNGSQKKKCNESRPQCDRCQERGLHCEYEAVKPRKRRRSSLAGAALSRDNDSDRWPARLDHGCIYYEQRTYSAINQWENGSVYQHQGPDKSVEWDAPYEDDVAEMIRADSIPTTPAAVVQTSSHYPDLAMIAPSPVASPLLEFCAPVFQEFTDRTNRRALVDHFCNVLSHLIVFKEDSGNPFRQLVLPLSHASSPVMSAIFALSSAHLEYRGIENQEKSLHFHNKALQGLAILIEQNDSSHREEVLGAIMLLVYYEVLVQKDSSNMVYGHLKGAMTVMKSGPKIDTPTTLFLERTFRFYDVIAALSLGTAPSSDEQKIPSLLPNLADSVPNSPLNAVDTLLGLSTDLWPIIHRLSHLLSFKTSLEAAILDGETSKATVLKTELESTSQAIEYALTSWKPTLTSFSETASDAHLESLAQQSMRIQSIYHNAEAYRHSAFVYLYRTIRSRPRRHSMVQKHTHLALQACFNVVSLAEKCYDGPMSALLWPLFVAACEAVAGGDRELAMNAFCGTERRQGMTNIQRAWEIVQEVWRRTDVGGEDVDWRRICEEKNVSIVFG